MEIVTENATYLAWIGDAVMSLKVRVSLLDKGYQNAHKLQQMSARICSAKGQSAILHSLMEENFFTEDECVILKRGRNATIHSKAKNASGKQYLEATALEAWLGYLYLYNHTDRLEASLNKIIELGEQL